jgi:hypothetical protein
MPVGVCGGTITDDGDGPEVLPPEIGVEVSHLSLVTPGSVILLYIGTESGFFVRRSQSIVRRLAGDCNGKYFRKIYGYVMWYIWIHLPVSNIDRIGGLL